MDTSFIDLLNLDRDLKFWKYEKLGLVHLQPLKDEILSKIELIKEHGRNERNNQSGPGSFGPRSSDC